MSGDRTILSRQDAPIEGEARCLAQLMEQEETPIRARDLDPGGAPRPSGNRPPTPRSSDPRKQLLVYTERLNLHPRFTDVRHAVRKTVPRAEIDDPRRRQCRSGLHVPLAELDEVFEVSRLQALTRAESAPASSSAAIRIPI